MNFEYIYSILASKKHNEHHLNRYVKFIRNCMIKNKNFCGYTENHHIIPKAKSLFPEYTCFKTHPWNCAILTARQHFIAHMILRKVYYWSKSANHAAWRMANNKNCENKEGNDKKITSRQYQLIKENLKHTQETKEKIGSWSKGKTYEELFGEERAAEIKRNRSLISSNYRHTDETKKKLSQIRKGKPGPNKGKPMKEESKRKLSLSKTGIILNNGRKFIIYDNNGVKYDVNYGLKRWWKENMGDSLPLPWRRMDVGIKITVKSKKYKDWSCIRIK